jgi:hypothetical protein
MGGREQPCCKERLCRGKWVVVVGGSGVSCVESRGSRPAAALAHACNNEFQ